MWKTILYIAVSLDGYIADENWGVDWLPQDPAEDYGYGEFLNTLSTTIMWNKTYRQLLTFWPFPYKDLDNYVITTDTNIYKDFNVSFISADVVENIKNIISKAAGDTWIIGWAQLVDMCMNNDLIDEIHIAICPTILWKWIKLFAWVDVMQHLDLFDSRVYDGGLVQLFYKIK